jgi:hypothetical protein
MYVQHSGGQGRGEIVEEEHESFACTEEEDGVCELAGRPDRHDWAG